MLYSWVLSQSILDEEQVLGVNGALSLGYDEYEGSGQTCKEM